MRANATRALHQIQQFILSLANSDRDGRVLLSQEGKLSGKDGASNVEVTLKYMLLAPAESFREVAEEARSVVLAGGTMAPVRQTCRLLVLQEGVIMTRSVRADERLPRAALPLPPVKALLDVLVRPCRPARSHLNLCRQQGSNRHLAQLYI